MHSDDEQFEKFLIDVIDRLSDPFFLREGYTISFSVYQGRPTKAIPKDESEAEPQNLFKEWCNALGDYLDIEALKQGFLAYIFNGNIDAFASKESCLQYLKPEFHKYSQLLSECMRQSIKELGIQGDGYVFRWNGESWDIVYEWKRVDLRRSYPGLFYIQSLLRHKGRKFDSIQIESSAPNRSALLRSTDEKTQREAFYSENVKAIARIRNDPENDLAAIRAYKDELKYITKRLTEKIPDTERSELIRNKTWLEKQLRFTKDRPGSTSHVRKPRPSIDPLEGARSRVWHCLDAAYKKLSESQPGKMLAKHLKENIVTSARGTRYKEDSPIDWIVD
jgi:hypothetical protein